MSFSFDIEAAIAGDDYDGKMGIYPLYKGDRLKSVHSRHVYVEDEDIDGFLENFSNRLRPAFHRLYLIALFLEDISQMVPEKFVVVGDQYGVNFSPPLHFMSTFHLLCFASQGETYLMVSKLYANLEIWKNLSDRVFIYFPLPCFIFPQKRG